MMIIEYGVTKSDAGLVSTLFFITYGAGQFINAFLSKKINIKIVLPIILFCSVLINIFVLFMPVNFFAVFKYIWCLNGFLLSMLWPCTIRTVSEYISPKYKNASVLLFGTITAVGVCITYGLSALFKALHIYKMIFVFASVVGVLSIILWCFFYKTITNKQECEGQIIEEAKAKVDETLLITPMIGFVIVIGFISIVCAIGKEGMQTWFPLILEEKFNMDESYSTLITMLFPFASIIASVLAVGLNKKIKNYVLLCGVFTLAGLIALCFALLFNFNEIISLVIATIILSIACASITNVTTNIIPLRIKNVKNSGFYAGFFNGCLYIGTSIVTYALGAIAENKGWNFAFITILIVLIVGLISLICYYLIEKILINKNKNLKHE